MGAGGGAQLVSVCHMRKPPDQCNVSNPKSLARDADPNLARTDLDSDGDNDLVFGALSENTVAW